MAHHPLEPLSTDEFHVVRIALRRDSGVTDAFRFCSVELVEPAKQSVLAWQPGQEFPRLALAVLWDRATSRTFEGVVDLAADAVVSFTHIPDVTPNFTVDEWHECDNALRQNPRGRGRDGRARLTELDLCFFDVWTYGKAVMPPQYADRRLGWADVWRRDTPGGNPYANPVAGLKFIVDMNTFELLEIDDSGEIPPAPVMGEYLPDLVPGLTVRTTQAAGDRAAGGSGLRGRRPGAEVARVGDAGRLQLPRGPGALPGVVRRNGTVDRLPDVLRRDGRALPRPDAGALPAHRLRHRRVGPGLHDHLTGARVRLPRRDPLRGRRPDRLPRRAVHDSNAVCIHEEDNLVLWKHVDGEHGAEVRRMRRFVVSCHATVANYEYLDLLALLRGRQHRVRGPRHRHHGHHAPSRGADSAPYGTVVDQRTYAPYHQHFLVARLDLDVDGTDNTVLEVDSLAAPSDRPTPTAWACAPGRPRAQRDGGRAGTSTGAPSAAGRSSTPPSATARRPVGYKLVPTAASRR